jgi:hypothetical protein
VRPGCGCGDETIEEITPERTSVKNPHIIVGAARRCLCGSYDMPWAYPPNQNQPVSCGDILAQLERLVQTKDEGAFLLNQVIQPLVLDCT